MVGHFHFQGSLQFHPYRADTKLLNNNTLVYDSSYKCPERSNKFCQDVDIINMSCEI